MTAFASGAMPDVGVAAVMDVVMAAVARASTIAFAAAGAARRVREQQLDDLAAAPRGLWGVSG